MAKSSFIFIPDISGFTRFVTSTELNHSQHIISELLEIVIAQNDLGLELAEVEGDAVLFYRKDVPTFEEVSGLAEKMFLAFHAHLRKYDTQRVCNCGACNTASKLSLKFIAHTGSLGFTTIQGKRKPFGGDLVLAHRLLKNSLGLQEYLLITEELYNSSEEQEKKSLMPGICDCDDVGEVNIWYTNFKNLLDKVPEMEAPQYEVFDQVNPVIMKAKLPYDHVSAFNLVADLNIRVKWNHDIKQITLEEGELNTIGTRHLCIFENGNASFETIKAQNTGEKLVYGERFIKNPIAKDLVNYFTFEKVGNETECTIEIDYRPLPVIGWLIDIFFRPIVKKNLKKTLEALQKVNINEVYS